MSKDGVLVKVVLGSLGEAEHISVHYFSAERYGDEIWLGFLDQTNSFLTSDEHPTSSSPYHLVKAKPGCRYSTEFEHAYPPE